MQSGNNALSQSFHVPPGFDCCILFIFNAKRFLVLCTLSFLPQFSSYGSGRFGHPDQDRAISIREGALLQTFPKDYDFGEEIKTVLHSFDRSPFYSNLATMLYPNLSMSRQVLIAVFFLYLMQKGF
jgi:site-specific DNA-cytosine methylase